MTQGRFTNLDAFRAIAALLVLLFHSPFINNSKISFFQNSDIFVDFFFILSGFVIYHSYLKKIAHGYSFKHFFQNRFARIYPLHIIILVIWLIFLFSKALLLSYLNIQNESTFITNDAYSFFLHLTLLNAHGLDNHLSWNAPAWSIGAEFYTYLVFFILVKHSSLAKAPLLAFIIVICAYLTIYSIKPTTLLRTFDLGFVRAIGGFFTGGLVYMASIKYPIRATKLSPLKMTAIELSCLLAIYFTVSYVADSKNGQVLIFVIFALTIFCYSQTAGLITKILNKGLFQQLGKISYSIYLLHLLIITIAANLWEFIYPNSITFVGNLHSKVYQTNCASLINITIIIITCLLAVLSYKLIERPLQKRLRAKSVTK